jgi:hypothetical protein
MSLHGVQHILSTASTQDCFCFLHSYNYELTLECSNRFWHVSLHYRPQSASSPWVLNFCVTLAHSHSCNLTNWQLQFQYSAHRPWTPSKYSSNLGPSRLLSSYNHPVQMYLHTDTITASKLAQSWHPSLHNHILQHYLQTRFCTIPECTSKFTRSRPPSVSQNTHNYLCQVHLQTRSITASMCISRHSPLGPPCLDDHTVPIYLQTYSITISEIISKFTRSRPPIVSANTLV